VSDAIIKVSSFSLRTSLRMFGRVAACSIAAFFSVSQPASVVIAKTQSQARDRSEILYHNYRKVRSNVAALNPAEPSIQSPAFAEPFGLNGVTEDDVRLVIVHDLIVVEDHAVVAARTDAGWIILDNRWLTLGD
jgi:hypothetical protein